jgi:hypothetical protein
VPSPQTVCFSDAKAPVIRSGAAAGSGAVTPISKVRMHAERLPQVTNVLVLRRLCRYVRPSLKFPPHCRIASI